MEWERELSEKLGINFALVLSYLLFGKHPPSFQRKVPVEDSVNSFSLQFQNTQINSQFSSVAQSCPTLCDPWTAECQAFLSITNSQSLLKLMSIESATFSKIRPRSLRTKNLLKVLLLEVGFRSSYLSVGKKSH